MTTATANPCDYCNHANWQHAREGDPRLETEDFEIGQCYVNGCDCEDFQPSRINALATALRDCVQSLKRLPDVDGAYRVTVIKQAEQALEAMSADDRQANPASG